MFGANDSHDLHFINLKVEFSRLLRICEGNSLNVASVGLELRPRERELLPFGSGGEVLDCRHLPGISFGLDRDSVRLPVSFGPERERLLARKVRGILRRRA